MHLYILKFQEEDNDILLSYQTSFVPGTQGGVEKSLVLSGPKLGTVVASNIHHESKV